MIYLFGIMNGFVWGFDCLHTSLRSSYRLADPINFGWTVHPVMTGRFAPGVLRPTPLAGTAPNARGPRRTAIQYM